MRRSLAPVHHSEHSHSARERNDVTSEVSKAVTDRRRRRDAEVLPQPRDRSECETSLLTCAAMLAGVTFR